MSSFFFGRAGGGLKMSNTSSSPLIAQPPADRRSDKGDLWCMKSETRRRYNQDIRQLSLPVHPIIGRLFSLHRCAENFNLT